MEAEQFDLFGPRDDPRYVAFRDFHDSNPEVYDLFVGFARQALEAGRSRFSGRTVAERIRWYTQVETSDPDGFKLNDHWAPFYVRMIERDYPEFAGFFEKRRAVADKVL